MYPTTQVPVAISGLLSVCVFNSLNISKAAFLWLHDVLYDDHKTEICPLTFYLCAFLPQYRIYKCVLCNSGHTMTSERCRPNTILGNGVISL